MAFTRRTLMGAGVGLAAGAAAAPALPRQSVLAIDREAENFLRRTGAPGLQIAMARHGQLGFYGAWGYADQRGTHLTHDHRFRIASLSKPVTAAAVMRLAELGRVNLDATVFGPGGVLRNDFGPSSGAVRQIRVRHLLSHTGGGWTNDGDDPTMNHPGLDRRGVIAHALTQHPLRFAPGSTQAYSNFGYLVLGRVIEKATGRGYESWVRANLLEPVGAGGMRVGRPGPGVDEVAYVSSTQDNPYAIDMPRLDSCGGWLANARELAAFVVGVDGASGQGRVLRPASARRMATPPAPGMPFGHGWQVNAQDNWWHTGLLPGTSSFMCRTRSGYAFAALTNGGGPGVDFAPLLDGMMWRMAAAMPGWTP